MGGCGNTMLLITVAVTLIDLIPLGIAKFYVGHNNDGSCDSDIPMYLQVSGFVPLAYFFLAKGAKDDTDTICCVCIGVLGILFGIAWHIFGSFLIFGGVQQSPKPCPDVFNFAFAMVTTDWIVILLWFLTCCACCVDN